MGNKNNHWLVSETLKHKSFVLTIVLLIFSLCLFYLPVVSDLFYESIYKAHLFKWIRWFQFNFFSNLPFNGFILLIGLVVVYYLYAAWSIFSKEWGAKNFINIAIRIINPIIWIIILFYWCWGFHYKGQTLTKSIKLEVKTLNEKAVREEVGHTLSTLLAIRKSMGVDSVFSITEHGMGEILEFDLDTHATYIFEQHFDLKTYGPAKVRPFYPRGLLYRLNTSGFYNPLTGECNYEGAMHMLQEPFVKAHEWCHAQGITDEGDANFLAYWICVESDDDFYKYSAYLVYWRYLMYDVKRNFPELYDKARKELPTGIKKDLVEIRATLNKYPEFMPKTRDMIYDTYLKTHGISEGMESYNRLVRMVVAFKRVKTI